MIGLLKLINLNQISYLISIFHCCLSIKVCILLCSQFYIIINVRGVTLHTIRDGIDTGEIIIQKSFLIEELLNDEYICTPQEAKYSTYFAPDAIDYANFKLNVKCTAYQIQSKIRVFALDHINF